MKFETNFGATS